MNYCISSDNHKGIIAETQTTGLQGAFLIPASPGVAIAFRQARVYIVRKSKITGECVMFKRHKPDLQVLSALTAAVAATAAMPKLQQQLTAFAADYQQGKVSRVAIGVFSSRISRVIYHQDYQVPTEVLALLSLLNQRTTTVDPGLS
ncbi:MAG: hypothetical protein LKJ48_09180 [Lactobacillus sp.]|jgi:hypothetical protein|nr:hypothetical protein [Lactobacillus sp.]